MPIAAIAKPADIYCQHLASQGGCGIYPDRPHECRIFRCMWLIYESSMPEALRPDRSHVVFAKAKINNEDGFAVHVDPDYPDAWQQPLVQLAIEQILAHQYKLAVRAGAQQVIVFTPGKDPVVQSSSPEWY